MVFSMGNRNTLEQAAWKIILFFWLHSMQFLQVNFELELEGVVLGHAHDASVHLVFIQHMFIEHLCCVPC